jgi:polysaccharide biosynthesis protein PslG
VAALRRGVAAAAGLAAIVALVVVLSKGSSPRPVRVPAVPATSVAFGANVGALFNGRPYGAEAIDAQLTGLAATGATVARADAPWEASEPQPPRDGIHHYDWAFDDAVAGALAAHHLRWLPIVDYSAPWAQSVPGQDHSPPTSDADFAAYAAALASRYGVGGAFWRSHPQATPLPVEAYEIWNEPDSAVFWFPQPDAARYAALYLAARAAIRAVQPDAHVIIGGLAHASTFIPQLAAAAPQLKLQLDGVGIHPYGPTPQAVLGSVRSARAALSAAGLGSVPLYVTEFGWATSPPEGPHFLPESQRPGYIEQTLSELGHLDCGLAAVLLYAWMTPESDPSNSNDWFGIDPPGGGNTPDMLAFTQGLHAAAATGPAVPCG